MAFFLHPSMAEFVGNNSGRNVVLVRRHFGDAPHVKGDINLTLFEVNGARNRTLDSALLHDDISFEPHSLYESADCIFEVSRHITGKAELDLSIIRLGHRLSSTRISLLLAAFGGDRNLTEEIIGGFARTGLRSKSKLRLRSIAVTVPGLVLTTFAGLVLTTFAGLVMLLGLSKSISALSQEATNILRFGYTADSSNSAGKHIRNVWVFLVLLGIFQSEIKLVNFICKTIVKIRYNLLLPAILRTHLLIRRVIHLLVLRNVGQSKLGATLEAIAGHIDFL